jgi:hypothetical protein
VASWGYSLGIKLVVCSAETPSGQMQTVQCSQTGRYLCSLLHTPWTTRLWKFWTKFPLSTRLWAGSCQGQRQVGTFFTFPECSEPAARERPSGEGSDETGQWPLQRSTQNFSRRGLSELVWSRRQR